MRVDIIDKKDILLAHIIPTGADPDIVKLDHTPNPTPTIKISEKIINTFFLFTLLYFFLQYSLSTLSDFNIFS